MEFVHPVLGSEIHSISGYYIPREEHTLKLDGRELLYVVGHACIDASCCGNAAWSYIQVPGFILKRNIRESTPPVSEVETIQDLPTRNKVKEALSEMFPGSTIEIW